MANSALFAGLAANWDTVIATGVAQVINNELSANALLLAGLVTLSLVMVGGLMAFGALSAIEGLAWALRIGLVSFIMVAANFTTYVQQPIMTDIPAWIASSSTLTTNAQSIPQQYDGLRNSVVAQEATILQQANGWTEMGERARADFATWLICLSLSISFWIWEALRGLTGLLVDLIPFVAGLWLFRTTRHVPLNLLGSIGSLLLLTIAMSILLNISINADQVWLAQARSADATVEVQLDAMKNIFLFFMFGTAMSVFLPLIIGRICGGIIPNAATPVVQGLKKLITKI